MHKVIPGDYPGVRVSIGYDIIDDLNWLPWSNVTLTRVYVNLPVFERQEDLFNTKLIPIPVYGIEQKFYTVSADWDVLMTECAKVHRLWEKLIKPDVPPVLI